MKDFKPPYWERPDERVGKKIFLAGSIEMGKAKNWQQELTSYLKDKEVTIFNPRRDDWDSSWEQTVKNEKFTEQVTWELKHIILSDLVIFFIQGDTKSPITLYEIGLVSEAAKNKSKKVIVCCEDEFWRRGNVEVVSMFFDMELVSTFEELKERIINYLGDE